ncbi:MAG: hypothetical protein NC084_08185 [Bacteroides sp.]|nr:hypothetical protein [Eubacterium sp.]MCM1418620.1 hypothetical protein [Roseburia sp.]MCM1462674.1 hypothetical protein [Bacteroides sp.]
MIAEILPPDGVKIGEKILRLGDSKCHLEKLFGQPDFARYHDSFYFGGALRVSVFELGTVDRIAFPLGADGDPSPSLYGVDLFRAEIDGFLSLHRAEIGDMTVSEDGKVYRLPRLGLTLSREVTPAEVEEMFRVYTGKKKFLTDADRAYEIARASRWSYLEIAGEDRPPIKGDRG